MANAWGANVLLVDTTAAFAIPMRICSIRYEAGSSGSITIKETDSSGTVVFFCDDTADGTHRVNIRTTKGIHVTCTNSAKVYIYTE